MNQKALQSALELQYQSSGLLGVNFAFTNAKAEFYSIAAGFSDLSQTQPLKPEQHFPIFSISKTCLAALTLLLQERGKLSIDRTIDRWMPDITNASTISIEHLLRHTSGLPDYTQQLAYQEAVRANPSDPWHGLQIVECALLSEPHFKPGCGWRYCNTGYWLLGAILERVAEQPIDRLIAQQICEPLELRLTKYPRQRPQLTPGWSDDLSPDRNRRKYRPNLSSGLGGSCGCDRFHRKRSTQVFSRITFGKTCFERSVIISINGLASRSRNPPRGMECLLRLRPRMRKRNAIWNDRGSWRLRAGIHDFRSLFSRIAGDSSHFFE